MNFVTDELELSQPSIEIDTKKEGKVMREVITELKDKITKNKLTALSAPQVGKKVRIFCVKFTTKKGKKSSEVVHTFINPIITGLKGIVIDRESDVSLPDRQFLIARNNEINILYQNPMGKPLSQKFTGKAAAVMQLMIDHLDGVLLTDLGLEIDERFDQATDEEKNELLEAYMKSLDLYKDFLNEDIKNDSALSTLKNAVDFIQSVREGETDLGSPISVDAPKTAK